MNKEARSDPVADESNSLSHGSTNEHLPKIWVLGELVIFGRVGISVTINLDGVVDEGDAYHGDDEKDEIEEDWTFLCFRRIAIIFWSSFCHFVSFMNF